MDYKLIGSSCGRHGPYTFYKAFKYSKNGKTNILAVSEFFFVKLWPDSDLISIGELQLLWTDKNSEQTLASLRLYILPENTPDGRTDIHGEDEVLAISEKVVLRVDDLLTWIHVSPDWHWGQSAIWSADTSYQGIKKEIKEEPIDEKYNVKIENNESLRPAISTDPPLYPRHRCVDMDDVLAEKQKLGLGHWENTPGVVVLSYPRYCRYRGLLKRLEGVYNKWLRNSLVHALGGFTSPFKNTKVLFCKDTFDYPELEGHELLCNHLAPKLKGRNANKRKKKEVSASEEEDEVAEESDSSSYSCESTGSTSSKPSLQLKAVGVKPRLRCTLEVGNRVGSCSTPTTVLNLASGLEGIKNTNLMDEKKFLQGLHAFMRAKNTPIGRIPVVGFKEVNLYKLYRKVIEFGGYDTVTNNKMWKQVYQVTGGDMSCTSAATLSRRHYEKLLLPYERFLKGKSPSIVIPSSYTLSPQARITQMGGSVKISPLKNLKTAVQVKTEKVGEKENIPERLKRPPEAMLSSSVTIIKKEVKEEVDQVSSHASPAKPSVTIKAAPVKKQKLDMLKQGGLEVTPVALSSTCKNDAAEEKPAFKKEKASPPPVELKNSNKVSITATPDISHLIGGGRVGSNNKVSITVTPDMTHLMYPWGVANGPGSSRQKNNSNAVVYGAGSAVGLPVEAVLGGQSASSSSSPIDLRTPKLKKPNIGSNLEISLIPSGAKKPQIQSPTVRSNSQQSRMGQCYNNPRFNAPIYTLKNAPNSSPYVPLIDPAYLCGNIVTQKLPKFTAPNPATSSPASINSFYKDLLRSKGIFNLLPDGSTSISLVGGQSTPTSK